MADELPALLDGSSSEDEPVSGVRIDASPGKPDFFVPLIVIDELPCAASFFRSLSLLSAQTGSPCDILLRLRQWEPDCVRSPSAGRQLRLR
eukprot:scaffold8155_cov41-Phaeocystis_antarctica.AAC.1